MPVPPPRPGFVDDVIAKAVTISAPRPAPKAVRRNAFARWETWMGAAMGAAVAVVVTVLLMRPVVPTFDTGVTLAIDESRTIDVLIDSERTLEDATIRVAAIGSVELDGFEDRRQVQWQTRLDRGRNVLSLPIVARSAGAAELVATIEHEGRTRRVAVKMKVKSPREKVA
jgi:hypothetical protein